MNYLPILKAKEGEYKAFPSIDPSLRTVITPLFEVIPVASNDVDGHLTSVINKLSKNLTHWPQFFVDFNLVDPAIRTASGSHPVKFVFDGLRDHGLNASPVTGVRRSAGYQNAVAGIVLKDHRGICLRLDPYDMNDPALHSKIDAVLTRTNCHPSDVHIILDFGAIAPGSGATLALTARSVVNALPRLAQWAQLTVVATAFPQSLADVSANSFQTIERAEWTAWNLIRAGDLARLPSFGDYGIAHPNLSEVDPRFMSMSANIRYTTNGDWLCAKGRGVRRFGFGQFHSLSQGLVRRPEYAGRTFSAADNYIFECANRDTGPGNATTWRWVGNVHHLTAVAREIANLSAT